MASTIDIHMSVRSSQILYRINSADSRTYRCGARVSAQEQRTLQNYLDDAAITARAGIDARWAVVCTQLSDKLQQAGGRENPRYLPAARRIARALYFDYSIQDDFYPQFNANTQALWPLLDKML